MTSLLNASESLSSWYERMGAKAPLRPFPTSKQEAWRVTNLKSLREITLAGMAPFHLDLAELDESGQEHKVAEIPGLTISLGEQAFSAKSINSDEFYEDIPKLFPQHSVRFEVSKSFPAERTFVFRWVTPEQHMDGLALAPMNVVWKVEAGAEIHLVKEVVAHPKVMSVMREEFQLDDDSRMEMVSLATSKDGIHLESRGVSMARNSSWASLVLDLGRKYSRHALNCRLEGEGAECRTYGALGLSGSQISEHPTILDHIAAHSTSTQLYKSVMNDTSRAVINGRVVIRQDAQKVDSSQYNKNLLLSQGAFVHSKPELRVAADDVKAAHGATTGQMDDDEIFYLRARGLSEARARELISAGFLLEVIESLSRPGLRRWASAAFHSSLPEILGGDL